MDNQLSKFPRGQSPHGRKFVVCAMATTSLAMGRPLEAIIPRLRQEHVVHLALPRRVDSSARYFGLRGDSVDDAESTLRSALTENDPTSQQLLIAIGEPSASIADADRGRRQARDTLNLLRRCPSLGPILTYREAVPYLATGASDADSLLLVETVLDPILSQPSAERMLATLQVVLSMTPGEAANRLYMRRQSLAEHRKRIEALTGFSLRSPRDRLCYQLAQCAYHLLTLRSATDGLAHAGDT